LDGHGFHGVYSFIYLTASSCGAGVGAAVASAAGAGFCGRDDGRNRSRIAWNIT